MQVAPSMILPACPHCIMHAWTDAGVLCGVVPAAQTLDRDKFQSAEEASAFGVIDEVIEQRPLPPPT